MITKPHIHAPKPKRNYSGPRCSTSTYRCNVFTYFWPCTLLTNHNNMYKKNVCAWLVIICGFILWRWLGFSFIIILPEDNIIKINSQSNKSNPALTATLFLYTLHRFLTIKRLHIFTYIQNIFTCQNVPFPDALIWFFIIRPGFLLMLSDGVLLQPRRLSFNICFPILQKDEHEHDAKVRWER